MASSLAPSNPILEDMTESGGRPEEMTPLQLKDLRDYFDGSLFAFAWTFYGFTDLEGSGWRPVHREICDLLALWGEDPGDDPNHPGHRLMVQVPRGSYKTSLCTLANAHWQISKDPNQTILICNEVFENAKKWVRTIREVASTNKLYQAVYRDILPPGIAMDTEKNKPQDWKWNDFELKFNRSITRPEASITAAGVGNATTGGHWDRIIKDDLVSEEAKNSPAVMARVKDWFDSSLPLERPPYKGTDLVVCTPWTYDDVYRYILENYDYKLYRRSVIEEGPDGDEVSILPKKWTLEELHKERDRNPHYFSAQMMCRPRPGKDQAFEPEWLKYFNVKVIAEEPILCVLPGSYVADASEVIDDDGKVHEPPEELPLWWCNTALLVDPAAADGPNRPGDDRARTGILAVALDPWGRGFILDCWAGRVTPPDVLKHIFRMTKRWGITRVGIEEVTFSLVYRHWLLQECKRTGRYLTVVPMKPKGRTKESRIEEKQHGFQRGMYYLNDLPQLKALKQEYIDYPYAKTRDLLDALAYDHEVLRRPESPEEREWMMNGGTNSNLGEHAGGVDRVTGY